MESENHSLALEKNFQIQVFENFLKEYFNYRDKELKKIGFFEKGLSQLFESMKYTLFSPCKRFRPFLVLGYLEVLNIEYKKGLPLAAAIELIHTASLIHDDLPSMDDGRERRGKACNHFVYGEDMALLSGDSLFIEAFCLLTHFKQNSDVINCVAKAASCSAMMGGQSLDLKAEKSSSLKLIQKIHQLKTGALIHACLEGVFCLKKEQSEKKRSALEIYSENLCEIFQIADDLQDKNKMEASSILNRMSAEQALGYLEKKTKECLSALEILGNQSSILKNLALINLSRSSSF